MGQGVLLSVSGGPGGTEQPRPEAEASPPFPCLPAFKRGRLTARAKETPPHSFQLLSPGKALKEGPSPTAQGFQNPRTWTLVLGLPCNPKGRAHICLPCVCYAPMWILSIFCKSAGRGGKVVQFTPSLATP